MTPSTLLRGFLASVVVAGAASAGAQTIVVDVGRASIGDYVVVSRSNDRSSVCDEYINPNALRVPGCTTADRGVGDGWSAPFSDGLGFVREQVLNSISLDRGRSPSTTVDSTPFSIRPSRPRMLGESTSRSCRTNWISARSASARSRRTACTASSSCIRSGAVGFVPMARSVWDTPPCGRTSAGTGGAARIRLPSRRAGISRTSTRFARISPAPSAGARRCSGSTCTCSRMRRESIRGQRALQRGRSDQAPSVPVGGSRAVAGATLRGHVPNCDWMAASPCPRGQRCRAQA